MVQQPSPTVQNHFQAGLKTEYTGLNFPENAATDTFNCVYSLVGDVTRRGGINYEDGFQLEPIYSFGVARSSYKWVNAGGDGESQILVIQIGASLAFYLSSAATETSPLSTTFLVQIPLYPYQAAGSTLNIWQIECQYATGNGFLFVYHPAMDPIFCTYIPGSNLVTAQKINIQIRDVSGIPENIADNFRPNGLSQEHLYNLINQGWTQGSGWTGNGSLQTGGASPIIGLGFLLVLSSQSSSSVLAVGNSVLIRMPTLAQTGSNNGNNNFSGTCTATVNGINGNQLSLTCTAASYNSANTQLGFWSGGNFNLTPNETVSLTLLDEGFINNWQGAFNNYPSNSDVWWLYKDDTGAFNPTTTFPNVQALNSPAPKGAFILNAFQQQRSATSGIGGLTDITTSLRPSTGAWYAGRVWYSGVNASQQASGDEPFYTWSENIYFSQIIERQAEFGYCYQDNDPTSENLFDILPSDGGVITVQGCGAIYKLFPLRFGLLVFAANGIWFISGSSGIGFTATDFTVTKISSIRAISGSSFIDVQGYPFFWNQEGIYQVVPSAQPGSAHSPDIQLDVQNLTLGTVLSYYNGIPLSSKPYARGDYDEINYVVQWCYRSTEETDITNRYVFDSILNFNVITKAFYPYSLPTVNSNISDIKYIISPGAPNTPEPIFKYITGIFLPSGIYLTFSEENNFTDYKDFESEYGLGGSAPGGYDYSSYFVTGYSLAGQGLRKIQVPYVYVFSRNPGFSQYGIRAIWDFAGSNLLGQTDNLSGKWSTRQIIQINKPNYTTVYRKVRLRGRGLAVQIKVESVSGQPFDIIGWSVWNEVNQGI